MVEVKKIFRSAVWSFNTHEAEEKALQDNYRTCHAFWVNIRSNQETVCLKIAHKWNKDPKMYKIIQKKIVKNECFYSRLEVALTEQDMENHSKWFRSAMKPNKYKSVQELFN